MADQRVSEFGDRLLQGVKTRLGLAGWNALSQDEQALVIRCCGDAAVVYADVQAGRRDAELKHVRAQLAGLEATAGGDVRRVIRDVFREVTLEAIGVVVAAAL